MKEALAEEGSRAAVADRAGADRHAGVPAESAGDPQTGGNFSFPPSDSGAQLFQSKGCAECHTGKLALESRLKNQTLTGIAAAMWNHQPSMKSPPPQLSQEEMRQILGAYVDSAVPPGRGQRRARQEGIRDKNCATCHNDPSSGAPKLAKGKNAYSGVTMVARYGATAPACWR